MIRDVAAGRILVMTSPVRSAVHRWMSMMGSQSNETQRSENGLRTRVP